MASMSPPSNAVAMAGVPMAADHASPRPAATPKNVAFELMFLDSPQYRARLPMRVQIYPHDTTDSIVTTVKNFYGLYSGPTGFKGVSFEDEHGNTLIARYENLRNNMIVYVRVIEESPGPAAAFTSHTFEPVPIEARPMHKGDGFSTQAPQQLGRDTARPNSRSSRRRSISPNSARGRRSMSASAIRKKSRSRSVKEQGSLAQSPVDTGSDSMNGYSSGEDAGGSASQLGNTDISVENIVEGGRRKRAKFESSELPLFAPPQMPMSTSQQSVSPARRIEHQRPSLPFVHPGQNPFTNRSMQSPHSYTNGLVHSGMYATPSTDGRRNRGAIGYGANGIGITNGNGILPTPDPTVGSCMSEEDKDVAIQLMRLGDMSNVSHGRTSASTLDDTFSGRADIDSSTGATSDGDSENDAEQPAARRQKLDASGGAKQVYRSMEARFMPPPDTADVSGEDADYEDAPKHKTNSSASRPPMSKPKAQRPSNGLKVKKLSMIPAGPMSPASLPPSRKQSIASAGNIPQPGDDDQPDLSSQPRCQRCRKSKKGCDRQRPCGRCRDAGLTADQCISEDEGNGRKGRYGRHMGVPLKTDDAPFLHQPGLLPAAPIATASSVTSDKSKKRKR